MAVRILLTASVLWGMVIGHPSPTLADNDTRSQEIAPLPGSLTIDQLSPDNHRYTGSQSCRECHAEAYELWQNSHHKLAMERATPQTVLGDFDNATFTYFGVESSFYKRDGNYYVKTQGEGGRFGEFKILYTFGAVPLQQYLVEFPGGKLQVLPLCWDSRPQDQGGQRWFHIYPDEPIEPDDELYWTGPNQNWNFMCAECHSTNLKKNYDFQANTYNTTFAEINVGCEACHGPGEKHIQWANDAQADEPDDGYEPQYPDDELQLALTFRLKEPVEGRWVLDKQTQLYSRSVALESNIQIETCARCHSRRHVIAEDYIHGRRLLDTHQLALLRDPLYHLDGQIRDEVYVYGSFIQSKMYARGVRCNDCHDPHSLKLLETGNRVCYTCHLSDRYDVYEHHYHQPDSATCVDCHMMMRKYMVVDPRYDHSLRVPRPDLTLQYGIPSTCTDCHPDEGPQYSVDAVEKWYGPKETLHWTQQLAAARSVSAQSETILLELARGQAPQGEVIPNIVKATALERMQHFPSPRSLAAAVPLLDDADPLVRLAGLRYLETLPPDARWPYAARLLGDPVLAVRIEAARTLAAAVRNHRDDLRLPAFNAALKQYVKVQRENADRPTAHMNLGNLFADLGRYAAAKQAYRDAMRIDGCFLPAYINLADLYRALGRETEVDRTLRLAIAIAPDAAAAHFSLGLSLIRQKRLESAAASLQKASELQPDNLRYGYTYALALHSLGQSDLAITTLEKLLTDHGDDRQLLFALASISRDAGQEQKAVTFAERLLQLDPHDPQAARLHQFLITR